MNKEMFNMYIELLIDNINRYGIEKNKKEIKLIEKALSKKWEDIRPK